MTAPTSVLLLTDAPGGAFSRHLQLLYPDRVTVVSFHEELVNLELLCAYTHVVINVNNRRHFPALDFALVREYAANGGVVACGLAEYARDRGLEMVKTFVLDGSQEPAIRICVENDITRGFAVGDLVAWFGKVSHAPSNDNNPNQYLQRQILDVPESDTVRVLGASNLNEEAVLIEETVGRGRILACDFISPFEPYFNSLGSTNKYLFLGNLIGGSVHYGKHYPCKLPYDELLVEMQALADRYPALTYQEEGACSDGRPLASLNVGTPGKPTLLLTNGIHGWEWEAGYGLLHLAELLASDTPPEGLNRNDFFVKLIPQLNPYGYDHDFRHNANGVDANRNFDCGWEAYEGGQDVCVPWDFDYKGEAPGSEPETQACMRLIRELKPACLLDFHTAHFIFCKTSCGNQALQDAIHEEVQARWQDRYLIGVPYSTTYDQTSMAAVTTYGTAPHWVCWADAQGVPASILIEMSGNRTGTQGLVMVTDLTIEICLAAIKHVLAQRKRG